MVLSHRLWLRLFEGNPRRGRQDAAPERPAAHDRRRDAAALRLVDERRASGCRCRRPAPTCRGSTRSSGWRRASSQAAAEEQLQRVQPAAGRGAARQRSRSRASRRTLRNYLDVTVASGEMRTSLQLLLGAVGVPAADRLRQRRQPAAGARHGARPRDGGPDVDRRRPPPAAAPAAHRERAAVARRRRARRAVRVRRDPGDRRADAGVLRAQRVARHDQPAGAAVLAGRRRC